MTRRWLVRGRVQGVGFRWFVLRSAERLGVHGLVRNLPDGRVEVVGQGSAEDLAELAELLVVGPPAAAVVGVDEVENLEEPSYHNFRVL